MSYDIYTPPPDETTLFVYDQQIELVGVVENADFIITRDLFGMSMFSFRVAIKASGTSSIQPGNIVSLGNSDSRAGLIQDIAILDDDRQMIEVEGYTLKGLLNKRIIVPPTDTEEPNSYGWESVRGPAETVLRHYFNLCCVGPRDLKRKIPRVVMEDAHDPPRGIVTPWYAEHKETAKAVMQDIGEWTQYGWDVRLDIKNKQLVYVTVPVRDRTLGTDDPVIFSRELDNLGPYQYRRSYKDYASTVYIGGAGEYDEQLVLTEHVDEQGHAVADPWEGWERGEAWLSVGNIDDPEKLIFEGLHRYNSRKKLLQMIRATVYNSAPYRYGASWDLGDKVTILIYPQGHEQRLDTQVIKVTEVYENGKLTRIDPVFGSELPTPRQTTEQIQSQL